MVQEDRKWGDAWTRLERETGRTPYIRSTSQKRSQAELFDQSVPVSPLHFAHKTRSRRSCFLLGPGYRQKVSIKWLNIFRRAQKLLICGRSWVLGTLKESMGTLNLSRLSCSLGCLGMHLESPGWDGSTV
jgi:hypothetical protein